MDKTLFELVEKSTETVEKENWKYYYQVDDYKFNNVFLANWFEKKTNSWAAFVAQPFTEIQNKVNSETFDFNVDYNVEYLKKLRKDHDRIVLAFSGGADSLTVLKKAIDNDIFIDELIAFATGDELYIEENKEIYENAIPIAEKYKGKYGKFTIKRKTLEDYNNFYKDPLNIFTYPECGSCYPIYRRMWNNHKGINGKVICGPEKPKLVYYNQKWYTTLQDNTFNAQYALDKDADTLYFNLEPDNIFSLIKDSIVYRNYLIENKSVDSEKKLQFFMPSTRDENTLLGRENSLKQQYSKHFKLENNDFNVWNLKDHYALTETVKKQKLELLCNYFNSISKLTSVYPDYDFKSRNFSPAKFGWFIDIDSLEAYTQQQLIPDGFEV